MIISPKFRIMATSAVHYDSAPSSNTPPPESSINHPLLSHHLLMKNEYLHHHHHHHHHRLYQPYQLPESSANANHYAGEMHYPTMASTSSAAAAVHAAAGDSRCSSASSSGGADALQLTLKSEGSSVDNNLELLDTANVILFNSYYFLNILNKSI